MNNYLEASGHDVSSGNSATISSLPFSDDFLVVVTAETASAAAQVVGSGQLDVRSLDLDPEVPVPDFQGDTLTRVGVDDGLDASVGRFVDLDSALLLQALESSLGSVDGNVTSGVQFDGILTPDDGNDLLAIASVTGGDGDLGFLVAIGHEDVRAVGNGVVVVGTIVGPDGISSNVALGFGDSTGGDVGGVAQEVARSAQRVEDLAVSVGQRRPGPVLIAPTNVPGDQSLAGTDESHVGGSSHGIALDDPAGAVSGVGLSLDVLDGEGVQHLVDPLTASVQPVRHGLGQVLDLSAQLVVVVGLVQTAGFGASGASVHETGGQILLALLAGRAVHGRLGGVFVAVDLSLEADLVVVALFTEGDVILLGQVENILAESVGGGLVPVAGSRVADGVVDLPVGADVGAGRDVLLDHEIGEVLGVPSILGQTQSGVEVDESAILLFSDDAGPHELSVSTLQVLEEATENGTELGSDRLGGDNLGLGGGLGLGGSRFEDDGVLAGLGGVLVLEESGDGAGAGAGRLVTQSVLTGLDRKRNEAQVGPAVDVPLAPPLQPGEFIGEVQFALLDHLQVETPRFTDGQLALDRLVGDADQVDRLVLESRLDAVDPVTGDRVRLDVVVDQIGDLAAGSPGDLDHTGSVVVEVQLLGSAQLDAGVDSGGDVVTVEGDLDAKFRAQLPAVFSLDVGLDTTLAVTLDLTLHRDQDGQSSQEAHGQTQFGGEADVVFGQHAVLGHADFVGHVGVLHSFSHELGDHLFNFLEVDEAVDRAHQVDVQQTSAFIFRAGSSVQLFPDALQGVQTFAGLAGSHRLVFGGQTAVELAEDVLPDISHVVVPHVDLSISIQ